jgi:hypothetical protein
MTQNIKNFIEEGEKELLNLIGETILIRDTNFATKDENDIKQFISCRQISLIKMIVDMVESEKLFEEDAPFEGLNDNDYKIFNQALDTISSKLKELLVIIE